MDKAAFWMFVLSMLLGAVIAGSGVLSTRLVIPPYAEWVCVSYEHGHSCKPASLVREFILHDGPAAESSH